ncbi:sulfatase-like hydrolase/transferase [Archangium violaceum]|uniref:sulfatase family protein n=1 Tax=Archangium violaceum TaxID=83451 RepID=UPI002B2B48DA|nr:sulfatase-like hydrolase/transferase [Archangium violaceum]
MRPPSPLPFARVLVWTIRGGLSVFLSLYTLCAVFNMQLGYQGNENPELETLVWREWRSEVLLQVGRLLTAHTVLGLLVGLVMGLAAWGLGSRRRSGAFLWGFGGGLLLALLACLGDMAHHPHLYAATLYERAGWTRALLLHVSQTPPALWQAMAALLVLAAPIPAVWRRVQLGAGLLKPLGVALVGAGVVGLLLAWNPEPPAPTSSRPNLLILASDGLRPDHLSGNGYPRQTSPHIDRLMREGSHFEETLVQMPRTGPSWTTLLSSQWAGQHPIRHTMVGPQARASSFPTLATALREAGWQTAVLSDYAGDIFSRLPLGFDQVQAPAFNFPELIRQRMLITQVVLLPWTALLPSLFPERQQFPELTDPTPLAASTRRALDRFNSEEPFALLIFASVTHFPYAAPHPYEGRFLAPSERGPWRFGATPQMEAPRSTPSAQDVAALVANYDAGVLAFDAFVGRVMGELERRGLADSTLVVILSDHGEHLAEGNRGLGHGEHLWGSEALRVPFILWWPEKVAKGRELTTRARAIDVAPTLLELLGLEAPTSFQGRSLASLLAPGDAVPELPELPALIETDLWFSDRDGLPYQQFRIPYPWLYEIVTVDPDTGDIALKPEWEDTVQQAKHRGLYFGRWKLLELPTPQGLRVELYDVHADPEERHEVSAEHPDVVADLRALLQRERSWAAP